MKTEQDTIEELESKLAAARRSYRLWKALVIVPIVASIALYFLNSLVMNFFRARSSPQIVACYSNLHHIGVALEMYSTAWSGKYPTALGQLTPNYLQRIPECPSAGSVSYKAQYGPAVQWNVAGFQDYYLIWCDGSQHSSAGVPDGFPFYDGISGIAKNPDDLVERR